MSILEQKKKKTWNLPYAIWYLAWIDNGTLFLLVLFIRFQSRPWNATSFFLSLAIRINDPIPSMTLQCPYATCPPHILQYGEFLLDSLKIKLFFSAARNMHKNLFNDASAYFNYVVFRNGMTFQATFRLSRIAIVREVRNFFEILSPSFSPFFKITV